MSWTRLIAAGRVSDLHQSFILGAFQARYHAGVSTERLSELFALQRAELDRTFASADALMDAGKRKEAGKVLFDLMDRLAKEPGPVQQFYAEQATSAAQSAATHAAKAASAQSSSAAREAARGLSKSAMRSGMPVIALATVAAVGLTGAALYMKSRRKNAEPGQWTDRIAAERASGQGQSVVR